MSRRIRLVLAAVVLTIFTSLSATANAQSLTCVEQANETSQPLRFATAIPVVSSLLEWLVQGTSITILYLPPDRYSIKRISAWLERQAKDTYPFADAVVGIPSAWSSIDLYPYLRIKNIGVIPIDAARAILPEGEQVAITPNAEGDPSYFWLNPANTLLMLGIIHRDLVAIIESSCDAKNQSALVDKTKQNYDMAAQEIRKLLIDLDSRISRLDLWQVAVEKPELVDIAQAALLPVVTIDIAKQSGDPTLLITSRKVGHKKLADLPDHILIWYVDDFAKPSKDDLVTRWRYSLSNLTELTTN
ncbi:MAG: hypothetical protein AAF434_03145 [Pseudomonadota bacterium]